MVRSKITDGNQNNVQWLLVDWQLKHRGDGLALRRLFHGNIAVAVLVHIVSIDFYGLWMNERIEVITVAPSEDRGISITVFIERDLKHL